MKRVTLPIVSLPIWLLENFPNLIFYAGLAEYVQDLYPGHKFNGYELHLESRMIEIEMREDSSPRQQGQPSMMAQAALLKIMN